MAINIIRKGPPKAAMPKGTLIIKRVAKAAPEAPSGAQVSHSAINSGRTVTPAPRLEDSMFRHLRDKIGPSMTVPWFLMASYLYYIRDISMVSDGLYDWMAGDLRDNWSEIEHYHKHLISPDDLSAGSMFHLRSDDYPLRIKAAARHLVGGSWAL